MITKSQSEVIRLSISGHHECPEMDTLFHVIADYQWVTGLARILYCILTDNYRK